jgi:hypothetical protein
MNDKPKGNEDDEIWDKLENIGWYIFTSTLGTLQSLSPWLLIGNLALPRVATLKTILSRLIYNHWITSAKRTDNHLQSSSVRCISSREVITNGPYWTTGWSRGSPATYKMVSMQLDAWNDAADQHEFGTFSTGKGGARLCGIRREGRSIERRNFDLAISWADFYRTLPNFVLGVNQHSGI